jgi:hypothetical protein
MIVNASQGPGFTFPSAPRPRENVKHTSRIRHHQSITDSSIIYELICYGSVVLTELYLSTGSSPDNKPCAYAYSHCYTSATREYLGLLPTPGTPRPRHIPWKSYACPGD